MKAKQLHPSFIYPSDIVQDVMWFVQMLLSNLVLVQSSIWINI